MLINVKPKNRQKRATVTTARVRSSLQNLVDGQLENIGKWMKQTAEGVPKVDANGNVIRDNQGSVVFVNRPDPAAAVKLVSELAEYVVPKLSRADVAVAARVEHDFDPKTASTEQLQQRLLESLGLIQPADEGAIIDVTPEPVPVTPDWLKSND